MEKVVRKANFEDINDIMSVINAAKEIMRHSGNLHQWDNGYPSETTR